MPAAGRAPVRRRLWPAFAVALVLTAAAADYTLGQKEIQE